MLEGERDQEPGVAREMIEEGRALDGVDEHFRESAVLEATEGDYELLTFEPCFEGLRSAPLGQAVTARDAVHNAACQFTERAEILRATRYREVFVCVSQDFRDAPCKPK